MEDFLSLCLSCGVVAHYLWKGEKICRSPHIFIYLFLFLHPICKALVQLRVSFGVVRFSVHSATILVHVVSPSAGGKRLTSTFSSITISRKAWEARQRVSFGVVRFSVHSATISFVLILDCIKKVSMFWARFVSLSFFAISCQRGSHRRLACLRLPRKQLQQGLCA